MLNLVFLDEAYNKSTPYVASPVKEFRTLESELGRDSELKKVVQDDLQRHGFPKSLTIDDVLEQQLIRSYLYRKGKGMCVRYPESPEALSSGIDFVFPYNLDPNLSWATLIALNDYHKKGRQPEFSFRSREQEMVNSALGYLSATRPIWGDPRNEGLIEAHRAARGFLQDYEYVKNYMNDSPFRNPNSFALMLAFAATYRSINEMFQKHSDLKILFPYLTEFSNKQSPESVSNTILGYYKGIPVKRYIKPSALKGKKLNKKFWDFLKARLTEAPVER
ncbi:hypothetical protein HYX04_01970 [Candidatus Woesearchaeota archaeon]|nr:hypothetical protein [Candidatus Woesearchaeota archaeon]